MIPECKSNGLLPAGIHQGGWDEFKRKFGGTLHRRKLLSGLQMAARNLKSAGCKRIFVNGSFITSKQQPNDFDALWDIDGVDPEKLDPVFLDFSERRTAQKAKYFGEFFPAQMVETGTDRLFLDFFQIDKETGIPKGIVEINLDKV
jgi:hypothetical protein